MKQNLLRFTLSFVILVYVFSINVLAEPAYPFPIKYKQPDGTTVTMAMKGDERISWAALNGENGWEYAQYNENGDLKPSGIPSNYRIKKKDWIEKMQDPNVDFKQLQKDFNEYWEGRTDYKGNGYKIFKRWEYINEFRISSDVKKQKSDYVYKTYEKYKKEHPNLKSASGSWTIQGPTSYVGNETGQPSGMGRINAIAFHPSDANTIFVGSPSGGFWKTTNHGASWTDLSANMPTLGVSSILIDPGFTSNNTIYLGSGDRDSGDAPGMGVFKSTDGGATWIQMNSGMGDATVGAMVMHPTNSDIIIAATSTGIYKTTNGGTSWNLKASGNFKDIKFKPDDPTTVYAVKILTPSEFYRSTDTGDNWTKITSGIPTTEIGSRMVIGVSAANPAVVYLVQIKSSDNTFAGLLRSTDSGTSFSVRTTTPNIFDYQCDGSQLASQATYDLCITVDPTDEDIVYVGSINNWKWNDNTSTWTIVSHWVGSSHGVTCAASVHADQHCYEWNNGKLYVGNDGGIYYTGDGGSTWPEITNNLAITQIYKIGQSATDADYTLFGCQDNGSSATTDGSTFTTVRGGDGAECLIDYSNTNYCYVSTGGGKIYRSTTGLTGSYGTLIASKNNNGIGDESATFQSPYMLHKTNASIMFAGYENVYRTLSDVTTGTVTWEAISTGETSTCRVLEQSPANVDILYAVRSGSLKRTDNANAAAGSVIWYACDLPGGITPVDIKADPNDEDNVFAVAGYKVYKSTDRGAIWTDISGSLPNLFINCLVLDKNANEGIYVGNQTGVWYKNADMPDWVEFGTGLPTVDIRELEIYYDDATASNSRIKAATYGRGLWESDLAEISIINPANLTAFPASGTQMDISWTKNTAGNNVMVAYSTSSTFGTPVNGTSYSSGSSIPGGGTVIYNGNGTSFSQSSLSPSTIYYYKAWSVNGSDYSNGTTVINEMTDCATTYGLPFEENFSAGTLPSCWKIKDNTGQGNWQFGTTTSSSFPTINLTATYAYFKSEYGVAHNYNADLISPTLDLSTYSNIVLKFKHIFDKSSTYSSTGTVSYSLDNGATWSSPIATYSSSDSPNPEAVTLNISAAAGQSQVKFKWNYSCSPYGAYTWAIDDIKITSSDFPTVATVPVTGTSETTASSGGNVTDEGASSVTAKGICWSTSPNSTINDNYTVYGTSSGAYRSEITGLDAISTYYIRAYASNNNGTSYGSEVVLIPAPVATAATNVIATGFTANWEESSNATGYALDVSATDFGDIALFENFDGLTTLTSSATITNLDNYLQNAGWTAYAAYGFTGSGYLMINSSSSGYLCTPSLDLLDNDGNYTLYFDLGPYSTGTDKSVIVSLSNDGGTTFSTVETVAIPTSIETQKVSITGANSTSKIKIGVPSGGSSNRFILDNIRIEVSDIHDDYNNLDVSATSEDVTVPTEGTYYYRVRAYGNNATSYYSNVVASGIASVAAGGNWSAPATWSDNIVPTATDNVIITSPGTVTVDISNAESNSLSIQNGATLTINPSQALTVNATFTNNSSSGLKILSDDTGTGSLITNALSGSGTAEIQRYMVADQWHIVAPPVTGQNINGLLTNTANGIPYKSDGDIYAVTTYSESINNWSNYFTSSTTGNLNNGTGYLIRRGTSDGVVTFRGGLAGGDVSVPVTNGGTYGWNCIGNPYTSAIGVTSDATSTNKFLGVNTDVLDDSYEALYIWNHETDDYIIINNAGFNNQTGKALWITDYIQSGQGFIVRANTNGSVSFTPEMQVHKPTQLFKSGEISWPGIIIRTKHNDELVSTAVAFNDDMTLGLDAGYDAGVYNTGAGFNIYTQLVQSNGVKFALQCLPFNQIESLVIPLGISIPEAGDYEFSIQSENIPAGVIPILNDLSENKQYEFNDSDEKYSVNIGEMVNSFGRFSISFSKNNLSGVTPLDENKINVWFSQGAIHINGSFKEDVQATVYDINGKKLAIKSFSLQGRNTVMFPEVANGVYLVNVQSGFFNKTFKVVAIGN